jgi:hypothetical protein
VAPVKCGAISKVEANGDRCFQDPHHLSRTPLPAPGPGMQSRFNSAAIWRSEVCPSSDDPSGISGWVRVCPCQSNVQEVSANDVRRSKFDPASDRPPDFAADAEEAMPLFVPYAGIKPLRPPGVPISWPCKRSWAIFGPRMTLPPPELLRIARCRTLRQESKHSAHIYQVVTDEMGTDEMGTNRPEP